MPGWIFRYEISYLLTSNSWSSRSGIQVSVFYFTEGGCSIGIVWNP